MTTEFFTITVARTPSCIYCTKFRTNGFEVSNAVVCFSLFGFLPSLKQLCLTAVSIHQATAPMGYVAQQAKLRLLIPKLKGCIQTLNFKGSVVSSLMSSGFINSIATLFLLVIYLTNTYKAKHHAKSGVRSNE